MKSSLLTKANGMKKQALPKGNASVFHDTQAVASWSYDAGSRTMVSYDTPQVVAQKVDYIKNIHLGGAMWWETSGDKAANGSESLINIAAQGLGGYDGRHTEKSYNCLEYPESKYDNLKAGMPNE
jgi:chitinase